MTKSKYKTPPLIEQFVELHLEKGNLPAEVLFRLVPKVQEIGFKKVEMGTIEERVIDLYSNNTEIKKTSPRVRCWNEEKNKLIQLFEDRIVLHQVGKYLGWGEFEKLFNDNYSFFKNELIEFKVLSIAFQTIDKFVVDSTDFEISKFLDCSGKIIPSWYKGSSGSADITLGKGFLAHSDGTNRQIRVSIRYASENTEINIHSIFHNRIKADCDLKKILLDLHEESNASFEDIVTNHSRDNCFGRIQ